MKIIMKQHVFLPLSISSFQDESEKAIKGLLLLDWFTLEVCFADGSKERGCLCCSNIFQLARLEDEDKECHWLSLADDHGLGLKKAF
jgi:hypothetical protein